MDASSTNMHKSTEVNAGGQSNGSPPMDSPVDMNCNLPPTVVVNQQTVTQPFVTDHNITTTEPRSSIEFKLQGHDSVKLHHDQQSQGGPSVSGVSTDKPVSVNTKLRRQMTIPHPAFTSTALSTTSPAVYALASTVHFPTVNQLTMNIPNQPLIKEQVEVPFRTNLRSPPGASQWDEGAVDFLDQQQQQQLQELQLERAACPFEKRKSIVHPTAQHDQSTEVSSKGDNVQPYFAAADIPRIPNFSWNQPQSTTESSSTESGLRLGFDKLSSELISLHRPPSHSESFFTATSNSESILVHHAVLDKNLDPNLLKKIVYEQPRALEDEATSTADGSGSVGSRSTVYAIAPLYNKGDHQATMLSSEDRVLKEGVVCQTMPLSERQSGLGSPPQENSNPTGPCERSCVDDGQPQFPHVSVGIAPTLNLDQLESSVKLAVTDSEETVESLIETKDWSKTGLGPRSSWPAELKMLMPLLKRSASPLAIYWGDKSYLIYNDVSKVDASGRFSRGSTKV